MGNHGRRRNSAIVAADRCNMSNDAAAADGPRRRPGSNDGVRAVSRSAPARPVPNSRLHDPRSNSPRDAHRDDRGNDRVAAQRAIECFSCVAIVAVEIVLGLGQTVGAAVDRHVFKIAVDHRERGLGRGGQVDFEIVGDEEVEQSVAVVIHEGASAAEAGPGMKQTCFLSHVGEGAIAVVAIEAILAVVGEEEILEAVVVVVSDANALRPSDVDQAGLDGDVSERAVAVVLVEAVGGVGRSVLEAPATQDEDVHPSVVVVVEEGAAGRHGLDDVGEAVRLAAYGRLSETSGVCNVNEAGEGSERFWRARRSDDLAGEQGAKDCGGNGLQQFAAVQGAF